MCNVRRMNNSAKQGDIVCWHKEINNLIFIVTETKLKDKIRLWIVNRFDGIYVFTFGVDSGYLSLGIAIIMDNFLACHVYKVSKVPSRILCVKLLFKNKLFVSILGLYAGASSVVWFFQTGNINFFIAKTVNKSFFIIFGSDFNENESHKCASFKKCFNLGLVNSLAGSIFAKIPTWCNSHGIAKTIDYVFVSSNLVNAMVNYNVVSVVDYFNTDHMAVSVSVDLSSLLDIQLSLLYKQMNKDYWKYDIKDADERKCCEFRNTTAANTVMFSSAFVIAERFLDLDAMWNIVCRIIVSSANGTFKKKWFKDYNSVFTKMSSKFHKLELLVFRLVKASHLVSSDDFVLLLDTWDRLDSSGAAEVKSLFLSGSTFNAIHSGLARTRKFYYSFKLLEFKHAKESHIKQAITSRIKSFESDKDCTIRSVLKHPFHKIVLDHLVVGDKLVLEPDLVKSKVDKIMES
ncbi:hypothetical protein G9A89_006345 [Geosiphon pyriformis]|nr:hypothetical protein G9A89_006345 [Geosiphon pyriformis]